MSPAAKLAAEALRPFAKIAAFNWNERAFEGDGVVGTVTVGHVRRAAEALAALEAEQSKVVHADMSDGVEVGGGLTLGDIRKEIFAEQSTVHAAREEEREACAKIAYIPPDQPDHDGRTRLPSKRDELGHLVRRAWVTWAKTQPKPKPSWLVPYSGLSPEDREADCQIGEAVANHIAAAIRARSKP